MKFGDHYFIFGFRKLKFESQILTLEIEIDIFGRSKHGLRNSNQNRNLSGDEK